MRSACLISLAHCEADKFTELQAATKSFAMDVIDTIKRLKLGVPKPTDPVPTSSSFPPLPPLPIVRRVPELGIGQKKTRLG
jgi:hypothetical protein